ncbi:MAG: GNAT family N-acetyltransferase [Pseudomonadota bacterium]
MTLIRRAQKKDWDDITHLLKDMDLVHGSISIQNFWVALQGDKVAAVAQLEPWENYFFLSSVGVRTDCRGRGIATALINQMLSHVKHDIYLYTIIPEFFEKLGFENTDPPDGNDYRRHFDCDECAPEKCACMKRPVTPFQHRRLTSRT